MTTSLKKIVMEFSKNLQEYLQEEVKKDSSEIVIAKGIQILVHLFRILYLHTRDIKETSRLTAYGCCCYLDYIHQIEKSDSYLEDASQCVYSKVFGTMVIGTSADAPPLSEAIQIFLNQLPETTIQFVGNSPKQALAQLISGEYLIAI
jgi:hypothetical protein